MSIAFGNLLANVTINDSGTTGSDSLILSGTEGDDSLVKTETYATLGNPATQRVDYTGVEVFLLDAGAGNDLIHDPGQNTIIWGGDGDDVIFIDATSGNGVTVDGGNGADTYIIQFGNPFGPVTIADSGVFEPGTGGVFAPVDRVIARGTDVDDDFLAAGAEVSLGFQQLNLQSPLTSLEIDAGATAPIEDS